MAAGKDRRSPSLTGAELWSGGADIGVMTRWSRKNLTTVAVDRRTFSWSNARPTPPILETTNAEPHHQEDAMPNRVTHKIIFDADKAGEIFAAVCREGQIDFEALIPVPLHIYRGNLSSEEEKDFPDNWLSWSRKNWGTKCNAYFGSCGVEDGKAFIKFDTAWSVPYPVISAFANKFNAPFEHRYFDEGFNFWGIENWSCLNGLVFRAATRKSNPDDERPLCIELKGYDPTTETVTEPC
jgi:hypothetical protein